MSYSLELGEDPGESVRRVVIEELDDAAGELSGDDPGDASVHTARKSLKKSRSAVRLARPGLDPDDRRSLNAWLRDAGRELSGLRDAAVVVEAARGLDRDDLDIDVRRSLADAAERLEAEADSGDEQTTASVATARTLIGQARSRIEAIELEARGWDAVGDGLEREYDRGREAMAASVDDPAAESVHAWRKRAKDLWYHQRLLAPAWEPVLGESVDEAHELADLLGDHHDLAVLDERLSAEERDRLTDLIAAAQARLLDDARSVGSRLYAEKPGAYGRRLRGYWLAWSDPATT